MPGLALAAADAVWPGADTSGGGRILFFRLGFRGERDPKMEGGLFIGISGARRVQMRCGFRPCDRDRKTEMMEEV